MPTRLHGWDYASTGAYFVTFCTASRRPILGDVHDAVVSLTPLGRVVGRALSSIRDGGARLDTHVIMPDHVHLLLDLASDDAPVEHVCRVVGRVKAMATRQAREDALLATGTALWQRGFFDRVVRTDKERDALREYIVTNPLRWTLERSGREHR